MAALPTAPAATWSVAPAPTVVAPEKVLVAARITVPAPSTLRPPAPLLIGAAIVRALLPAVSKVSTDGAGSQLARSVDAVGVLGAVEGHTRWRSGPVWPAPIERPWAAAPGMIDNELPVSLAVTVRLLVPPPSQ